MNSPSKLISTYCATSAEIKKISNCFKYFVQSSSKRAEVRFLQCNHFIPSTERYFFLRFRQKVYVVVIHYRMPLLHGLVDISHHQFVLLSEKRGVKQAPRALVNFSAGSSISNCWEISKEDTPTRTHFISGIKSRVRNLYFLA